MLCEPVGFIANRLAELEPEMFTTQANGLGCFGRVNQLFLLGERNHPRRLHAQLRECFHRRVELPNAAVDQNQIGIEFFAVAGIAISPTHNFAHRAIVIVGDRRDAIAAIALFEGLAINETNLRSNRLAAA